MIEFYPVAYWYQGECSGGTFCNEIHPEDQRLMLKPDSRVSETRLYSERQLVDLLMKLEKFERLSTLDVKTLDELNDELLSEIEKLQTENDKLQNEIDGLYQDMAGENI